MHSPHDDYVRSLHQARKARRRGDLTKADQWTRIAERHLRMATRLSELKAPYLPGPPWTPSATLEDQKAEVRKNLDELLKRMEAERVAGNLAAENPVVEDESA